MKATTTTSAATANATTTSKTKKRSSKKAAKSEATTAAAPEQQPQPQAEATASKPSKHLVFKRSRNNGFYVYLLGVMPDENMRFMLWKKRELGASISEQHFNELKQLAAAEG